MSCVPPRECLEVDVAGLDVSVSPHTLRFGLGTRQAPVDYPIVQELEFNNRSRSDYWVDITCIDDPSTNFKYSLACSNAEPFLLKGNTEKNVVIQLVVLCTTKLKLDFVLKTWGRYSTKCKKAIVSFEVESQLSTKLDPDELKKERKVGAGNFGVVYKGKYRGRNVAIKEIKDQPLTTEEMRNFEDEASMLEKLRHEAIVTFIGAVHIPEKLCLVTEFAAYGSFYHAMMEDYPDAFNEALKVKCLLDASCALDFLHQSGISHRDLKPDNLLIVSLEPHSIVCAKLSDFGTTRDIDELRASVLGTKGVGTPLFMAPEQLKKEKYDKSVDVYSFSFLMYTAFAMKYPFEENNFLGFAEAVIKGERPEIPKSCPEELSQLMKKCWSGIPSKRPSFEVIRDILENYFEEHHSKDKSRKSPEKEERKERTEEKKRKEPAGEKSELLKKFATLKLQTDIKWDEEKNEDFVELCALLKDNRIKTKKLDLSLYESEIEDIKLLSDSLESNTTLTTLCLDGNEIGDEGALLIGRSLKKNSSLIALSLEDNNIGKVGIKELCEALIINTTLKELWLYTNNIGVEGTKLLRDALKRNSTLVSLDIRSNNIKDEGAHVMSEVLKVNTSLTYLYLGSNNIGTEGILSLCESLLGNTTLTTLNLDFNIIGSYPAKIIADTLEVNTTLKELWLRGNPITDSRKAVLQQVWDSRGKLEL